MSRATLETRLSAVEKALSVVREQRDYSLVDIFACEACRPIADDCDHYREPTGRVLKPGEPSLLELFQRNDARILEPEVHHGNG